MSGHTKRTLAILLGVCFLVSLTATAVSAQYMAHYDQTWGPVSKQNYATAYNNQESSGTADGQKYGAANGQNDCQTGAVANNRNTAQYHKSTTYTSAAALGAVDGYNDWFDYSYAVQYNQAYNACISAGQQNEKIVRMG